MYKVADSLECHALLIKILEDQQNVVIFKIIDLFSNRFHSDTFSLLQKENIQHLQF